MLSPPAFSAELRLLAACVLLDDAAVLQALRAPIDWHRFGQLAKYNDVQGLAGKRLRGLPSPPPVPAVIMDDLHAALREDAIMHLSQTAESARLIALLDKAGISALVLKGAAVAQQLYGGDPECRRSSDIDILIGEADLDAADRALVSGGFRRSWPEGEPPRHGRDMFLQLANVFNYVHPQTRQLIELHHRITLNPYWLPVSFAALFAESEAVDTRFGSFRCVSGDPLVSYLSWHALSHGDYRLKWFGDLVRALRREQQASLAACLARDSRPLERNPSVLADGIVHVLTGGRLGVEAPDSWGKAVAQVVADMDEAVDTPTKRSLARLPREIANLRFVMRLSSHWRGKAYAVLRTVSDPRDAELLGLGVRWAWLYGLLGPLLAVRRFLLGLLGVVPPASSDH